MSERDPDWAHDIDLAWARRIYRCQSLDRQLRATIAISVTGGDPETAKAALTKLRDENPDDYALLLEHVMVPNSWLPD